MPSTEVIGSNEQQANKSGGAPSAETDSESAFVELLRQLLGGSVAQAMAGTLSLDMLFAPPKEFERVVSEPEVHRSTEKTTRAPEAPTNSHVEPELVDESQDSAAQELPAPVREEVQVKSSPKTQPNVKTVVTDRTHAPESNVLVRDRLAVQDGIEKQATLQLQTVTPGMELATNPNSRIVVTNTPEQPVTQITPSVTLVEGTAPQAEAPSVKQLAKQVQPDFNREPNELVKPMVPEAPQAETPNHTGADSKYTSANLRLSGAALQLLLAQTQGNSPAQLSSQLANARGAGNTPAVDFSSIGLRLGDKPNLGSGASPAASSRLTPSQQASVLERVQKALEASVLRRDPNTLVIRMTPPDLGEVMVKLTKRADQLFARFQPESQAVETVLRGRLPELAQALGASGLKAENIHISFGPEKRAHDYDFAEDFERKHGGQDFSELKSNRRGVVSSAVSSPMAMDRSPMPSAPEWVA